MRYPALFKEAPGVFAPLRLLDRKQRPHSLQDGVELGIVGGVEARIGGAANGGGAHAPPEGHGFLDRPTL